MNDQDYYSVQSSLITIASEFLRLQRVYEKAISKLDREEQSRYMSQFSWFSKRVYKALDDAKLKLVNLEGQIYDPGMAVTPLNIDEFEPDDDLYIVQMIEPVVMGDDRVIKTGIVILGRKEV